MKQYQIATKVFDVLRERSPYGVTTSDLVLSVCDGRLSYEIEFDVLGELAELTRTGVVEFRTGFRSNGALYRLK